MVEFSREHKYETQNIKFAIIYIIHDMYVYALITKHQILRGTQYTQVMIWQKKTP